jgi:hypothetical protein
MGEIYGLRICVHYGSGCFELRSSYFNYRRTPNKLAETWRNNANRLVLFLPKFVMADMVLGTVLDAQLTNQLRGCKRRVGCLKIYPRASNVVYLERGK